MNDTTLPGSGPRPRVLLQGLASARPEGLERALSRAGYQVTDSSSPEGTPAAVVITLPEAGEPLATLLRALAADGAGLAPTIAVLRTPDREAVGRALALGADDAMAEPVHLPEVLARVQARIETPRRAGSGASPGAAQEALLDLVGEAHRGFRPDELLHTLVRRLAHGLDLASCALVLVTPGSEYGRVVAEVERRGAADLRLEIDRYPEIAEAIRTARTVVVGDVHADPLFAAVRRQWAHEGIEVRARGVIALPIPVDGRVGAVLLLRSPEAGTGLTPAQARFAEGLARAAGRVLESAQAASGPDAEPLRDELTGCATFEVLDRRLRDEFDRARRYALSFSLVLLDVDRLRDVNARLGADEGDRILGEAGAMLRREVRSPDLVVRYGGDEFALLLPETAAEGARESVLRMRRLFAEQVTSTLPHESRPCLSAGIVAFPHPAAMQTGDLLALLEAALARAKAQSGERIAVAG